MFFENRMFSPAVLAAFILLSAACGRGSVLSSIREGQTGAGLSIPSDHDFEKARRELSDEGTGVQLSGERGGEPLIMNAIKDEATGEMVATDIIAASTVVARFRNVAERFGRVLIEFDVTVPEVMMRSDWKLRLTPVLRMAEDTLKLSSIDITGKKYRDEQMRGYRRYKAFLASILTDSTDFVRMNLLEVFLSRNFPQTYAMKTDSSFIADPQAENIFGVSCKEALDHYTRHYLKARNDRKIANTEKVFKKYVKDPIGDGDLRLDTVMTGNDGTLVYRYVQELQSRPGLRRIDLALNGDIYRDGRSVCPVSSSDDLTFYVSSLASLADMTPRFRQRIIERKVFDKTHAFLDFAAGSTRIDTSLLCNASELRRIRKCIDAVRARSEFELDSLVITASCSPEGLYSFNMSLSEGRACAVAEYLKPFLDRDYMKRIRTASVPENWELLSRMSANDSILSDKAKRMIRTAAQAGDKDFAEAALSALPEYRYMREKLYPRLRTVLFDFHLHRKGMQKDTVHTSELDSAYLGGVEAIKRMDYKRAVEILRPYHDYNTALAYLSSGYNHSALADLEKVVPQTAGSLYLSAIALSRLGRRNDAMQAFRQSVNKDSSMIHRANLDPELSEFVHLGRLD